MSIFTSFSRKEREAGAAEKDLEDMADLRLAIINEANSMGIGWATDKCNYVGLIIEQAVGIMLRVRTEGSIGFLGLFRAAIGEAVSPPWPLRPGKDMYKNEDGAASSLSAAPAAVELLGAL
ncbi:hypothetical protein HBI22_195080 [Parastagonospora nodorum]|nr:hypothetical protein HBI28_171980 [Parastagonospora nodorum]KAH5621574.1 hypothetical protein HBI22_195080 [Parastagonospora nodorum]KAH6197858.1 hypothetical protein HBI53_166550 [Parastagonospora nodorum]